MDKACGCCACGPVLGCLLTAALIGVMIFAAANSMFHRKDAGVTSGGTSEWTTATLPQDVMDKINSNKAVYMAAALANGIEWELLAALNYRESGLSPAGPSGEPIGSVNPDSHKVECHNFLECETVIGAKLKRLAKMVYDVKLTILSSDEDKKNAFLSYNRGFMYKNCSPTRSWDVSPYVMNQFDTAHKDMIWPAPGQDSTGWTCETIPGQQDANHGAFTVYVILKGRGGASDPGGGGGGFSGGGGGGSGGGGVGAD